MSHDIPTADAIAAETLVKLIAATAAARRLANDIGSFAAARPETRDHPLIERMTELAWGRYCHDRPFYDALCAVVASLRKGAAAAADSAARAALSDLHDRGCKLREEIDDVRDHIFALLALEEARLFPPRR